MKPLIVLSTKEIEMYGGVGGDLLRGFEVIETKPIPLPPKAPIVGDPWPPQKRR